MKVFLALVFCFFSFQISAESAEPNKPLLIVSTIKPLNLLVRQITANTDDIAHQLLPANSSPHHYQLSISDRQKLQSADLVLWVGPSLETFLKKPLKQRKTKVLTASQLDNIHWVKFDHEHDHGHDHGHEDENDPHLWLDPHNLVVIAQALSEELKRLSPNNAASYQKNTDDIVKTLAILDEGLKEELQSLAKVPFIVMHPAYGHFVDRYKLNQQDFMVATPERGIGAKHLYTLRKLKSKCVFGEEGQSTKLAEKIASATGAKLGILDPLGFNVSDDASAEAIIQGLASSFSECLLSQN